MVRPFFRTTAATLLLAIVPQLARAQEEAPAVPPLPAATDTTTFDLAAVKVAMKAVAYADCGVGGRGRVQLTFASDGSVTSAAVMEGNYSTATKACIAARFAGVKIPSFADASEHSVSYTVTLPSSAPATTEAPAALPPPPPYYVQPPKTLPYQEGGPIYAGYRVEERSRTGLIIGGGCTLGAGALLFLVGLAVNDDKQLINPGPLYMVLGGVAAVTGLVMLVAGASSKRKVLVRQDATLVVPIASTNGGGLALIGSF